MQNDIKNTIIIVCDIYLVCYMLMLRKNKKLIISIFSIFSLCMNLSLVYANPNSDCEGFATMSYSNCDQWENGFWIVDLSRWTDGNRYSNFLTTEQQLLIIDKESISTAMLNLKKYCCENKLWWLSMESATCKEDKEFYNDNIIDSPYLFDHLFDVIMRRLSGLRGEYDIYTKLEMWSDDKGLEWREWIDSQAENPLWSNPQIIIDKYKEFWQKSSPDLWYDISDIVNATFREKSDDDFLVHVSGQWWTDESELVAEAIRNYDKWTLHDRYDNACAITQYLYVLLDLSVWSADMNKIRNTLSKWNCHQVVENQIENESYYVEAVILQSWNLFLQNYLQWYLSYLYGRTQNLQKIWTDATDRFLDVVRSVPNLVDTCVK